MILSQKVCGTRKREMVRFMGAETIHCQGICIYQGICKVKTSQEAESFSEAQICPAQMPQKFKIVTGFE